MIRTKITTNTTTILIPKGSSSHKRGSIKKMLVNNKSVNPIDVSVFIRDAASVDYIIASQKLYQDTGFVLSDCLSINNEIEMLGIKTENGAAIELYVIIH